MASRYRSNRSTLRVRNNAPRKRNERGDGRFEEVRLETEEIEVDELEPPGGCVSHPPWRTMKTEIVTLTPEHLVSE